MHSLAVGSLKPTAQKSNLSPSKQVEPTAAQLNVWNIQ
jgi:hypothetical protein